MTYLSKIEVKGVSEAGEFSGSLQLSQGLQVVTAHNSYGKSLAVEAIAWCLGLEPIFGSIDNDPIRMPEAVREQIELDGHVKTPVITSTATITICDGMGRELEISRDIKGGDSKVVTVREKEGYAKPRESMLVARRLTMQDAHGGFQRFLFEWLKWPRMEVATYRPGKSEIYLENLAPLFYIDQDEGWSNIQALQIARYAQQEISQIAVEYLLGAFNAVRARVSRLEAEQRERDLKESARLIAEQAIDAMMRRGWRVSWSSHGSLKEIISRWGSRSLHEALKHDASVDIETRKKAIAERIEKLRSQLTSKPIDPSDTSAAAAASQRVVSLKEERHTLNSDLNTFRVQQEQASTLVESLEHRISAATDLLRLKSTGVGRLDQIECPTCHRDMDASMFGLTAQSAESVSAHIEALKRDRDLMRKNLESLSANARMTTAKITERDSQLRDAERALMTVTNAVGTVREQIAATASDLTAAEREFERLEDASAELDAVQASIDRWVSDATAFQSASLANPDVDAKKYEFTQALRKYLIALGHSAVRAENMHTVELNDEYVPFMEGRRLRSLGSASDQSRLVAAYSLALAAASGQTKGEHPGFVVLDEPLQQNPDEKHRELFLTFLEKQLAQNSSFQTLIFTWLTDKEILRLRKQKTSVISPAGEHFLKLVPKASKASGKQIIAAG